ncbi:hydantoinase/oxoprolinase family protein [Ketogulonicigenium vulgare]|uniref:5-oxoprolinase (ATP-hydrolyzing) n=1 Tax=Ketogulonicigenium vulgare (strain WSH-001) TaxID=759362 RepID=F9YBR7_KETVW|nr:hydantoinase/oxoprolinase family protein [Ketogulonicigenium vulgare]AEM42819.1 5-oxoprolinase (ATP-hydrolyzing) [Ketogulonicigenium vulgare WSH-001]ALJ82752.1 hypothetical protein KVH_15665 [Ketogulonicigenium vulgare]
MTTPDYRIGCDVGGSFTDFILFDAATGALETLKVATTPAAPEQGIMQGLSQLAARHPDLAAHLNTFIHGTTLVINAILERKGAKTALLTTEGFRDIIETRREIRYDIYDIRQTYPSPIVPRNLRRPVPERMGHDGQIVAPLDTAKVRAALMELANEGVESVAVCLINAYANPAHEREIAKIAQDLPLTLSLSLSADILPEVREFERFSTTALNAYVKPKVDRYLGALEENLRGDGFAVPVYLMQSGGGIVTAATARAAPVRLAESGPVGGVLAARDLALAAGYHDAIAFDMGGTTAKTCLIRKGEMPVTRAYEVDRVHRFKRGSGTPLAVPTVDLIEIGAGGGSIAHIDGLGRLCVGPESAVADPGPACFGRGGALPTVTDANLLLGYLDPAEFAAGGIRLDRAAAEAAVAALAVPLGLSVLGTAAAMIEVVNENMSQAARIYAAENGGDLTRSTMVAFGGGGPLHGAEVARRLRVPRILVPEAAGVFSAMGFLMATPRYEVARSHPRRLSATTAPELQAILDDLLAQARSVVAAAAPDAPQGASLFADLRYFGQGHQLRVPLDDLSHGAITAAFRAAYLQSYGYAYDDMEVELVTLRAEVHASSTGPTFRPLAGIGAVRPTRLAWDPIARAMVPHQVVAFATMKGQITGPALINQPGATIHVSQGATATRNPAGWLDISLPQEVPHD